MNSVYSRRSEASQPACIVTLTTGSRTGRGLVTTSCTTAGVRSTEMRPNRTWGIPSASLCADASLKHSDGTFSPAASVTGTTMRSGAPSADCCVIGPSPTAGSDSGASAPRTPVTAAASRIPKGARAAPVAARTFAAWTPGEGRVMGSV
jgi:hypothetical protein